MKDARSYNALDTLRNGTPIVIRAVRADDRQRIAQAFAGLERESVYTRFFSIKPALSDAELGQIDAMDFVRDVMLVVTVSAAGAQTVIASARYIARDEADGSLTAEVAFTVEEDYQGNGIAGRLLGHLARIARDNGIARLEADVLPENGAMLAVFRKSGLPMNARRDGGVFHVTLALSG
jgi:RimJ/RimL family protein N-acetyltransferase